MILKYYNIEKNLAKIKKKVKVFPEFGTYVPQRDVYFIEQGLDVSIVTLHPKMFTKNDINLSQSNIKKRFAYLKTKIKKKDDMRTLQYFINFMELGGRIIPTIPTLKIIEKELKAK